MQLLAGVDERALRFEEFRARRQDHEDNLDPGEGRTEGVR
jgi:hypothetical protein